MRLCPTFCLLPKENFIEGTLNKDASDHVTGLWGAISVFFM